MHFLPSRAKVKHVIGKEGIRNDLKLATTSEWHGRVYELTGTSTHCTSCLVRWTSRISYASGKKGKYVYLWIRKKIKEFLIMEETWSSSPDLIWDGDKKNIFKPGRKCARVYAPSH